MNTTYRHTKQITRLMAGSSQLLAILMGKLRSSLGGAWEEPRRRLGAAWSEARVWLEAVWSMARVWLEYAYTHLIRNPYAISVRARRTASPLLTDRESAPYGLFLSLLLIFSGVVGSWGQDPKVSDGIYYIQNNNSTTHGYLWPSVTTNGSTGYRYLTTSLATTAEAVNNNNGVTYSAHDKSYSHWVVKNVIGGYIQLINPRLDKYVVIRTFPKANNTKQNAYGDRDVWLTDEPAAEDKEYSYFVLNNNNSPYKISPKPELNGVNSTTDYSLNSAAGDDRVWLTWSEPSGNNADKPRNGEGRGGLIQFFSGGTPEWTFTSDLLDAPTINDVNASSIATITEKNNLPEGYRVRYTFGEGSTIPEDPTASSPIMDAGGFVVRNAGTLKVVIERYGVVLTKVDSKYVEPTLPTCANPSITYDNATGEVTISSETDGVSIYYTTDGTTTPDPANAGGENPTKEYDSTNKPTISNPTTFKAVATLAEWTPSEVTTKAFTKVETPTIVNNGANIVMSCATDGATIYYTTATGIPSTAYDPSNPPVTSENIGKTFRAIAKKDDCITSDVRASLPVKALCHMPVISFNNETGYVTITKGADNETIHYTTDGTDPTALSTEYTAPFEITTTTTIKAIAIDNSSEKDPSVIATEIYSQVETPTIQKEDHTITITATEGATIYYKIGDETTPHVYSTALGLSDKVSGRKISAYAMKTNMVTSTTAVAAASDTKLKLTAPVISIPDATDNGNVQFSINSTFEDAVTYYYTLDGTTTPTSSTPTSCTGYFTLYAPAKIKVIATSSLYETSDVATSSSYVIPTNTSVLIQSKQSAFYYLIPNLKIGETDYPKNLTTLNVPCNTMVWKFENAADNDGQYFYIRNSQGGYLYYTATDNDDKYVYFNANKVTSDDGYKFSIIRHNSGGYNIIPKGQTTPINKPSITATGDANRLSPVKLTGAVGDVTSRWEILSYTGTASLSQWTTAPFTTSDNNNTYFYRINSVSQSTKPLILNNDGNIRSQTLPTSNYDLRKSVWVIKKVGSDEAGLLDYYTFQNPYTGDLLYYNGKGRGVSSNLPVLQMGMPTVGGANETWSHFVIVQTINGYNIIPRDIIDNTKAISRDTGSNFEGFNCINRAGGNDSPGTWYDNDNGSRWTFAGYTDAVKCMPPVITYQDNKIRISTIYDNATIYYTTNGDDPKGSGINPTSVAINSTELYTDIDWNDGISGVKAFVRKTGYTDSETETYTISFAAPVISYDAYNDKIIISQSPGATVYYTTGETAAADPTDQDTPYTYGSTGFELGDNINVIKAKAYKGDQTSDVVTLTIPVHAHTTANDRPYLIQSVQSTAFYMIPGDVDKDGITRVNTSSFGRPSMEWYFIGAGYDGGVTYYYIKNKATNEYVYYYTSGNNSYFSLHTAETFDYAENKSGYKFCINYDNTSTNPAYYIIHPLNNATATNGISKASGNNAADVINLASATSGKNPEYARWNFIRSANKPAMSPQLKVWGSNDRKYYKITRNTATDATATYLVPRTQTVSYAMVSVAADVSGPANSILWYFDVAYSDEWVTYYYVVNAATGEYLYFNGDETQSANDNALEAREELVAADNDRYLFAFAKTTTADRYYILPKALQDLVKNSYSLVFWDGTSALTSAADRAADGGKWYLTEADVTDLCPPRLTLDADGKVTMASRTRGAIIKYEVGSEAEQTFDGTTNPIKTMATEGEKVVITTKTTVGETTTTNSATVVYKPTITLAEQSVVYNGQTHAPELSSVTMGDTELKDYCVVSSNDINAGDENAATAIISQKENNPYYADPYYVVYGTAQFTIEKSPLTIYANGKMIEYGDAIPELSFSTNGLATIDEVHVKLNCGATASSKLGTYPITFSNLDNKDVKYEITRNNSDASPNYKDITLIPSSLIITGKSLGDGTQMAEGITAELTTNGEGITITAGTSTELDENDYGIAKTTEGLYDDFIWTITGKGYYTGSAKLARVKSNFTERDNEWRAGYVASHDWAIPEGSTIKAWIATYVDTTLNVLRVKEVNYLPKEVPAILTATDDKSGGVLVSPKPDDIADLTDAQKDGNLFKVVENENGLTVTETDTYKYVFHKGEMVLAFKGTLPKGTIYINRKKNGSSVPAGAPLLIVKEDEITGIVEINENQNTIPIDDNWYSLDGRKLSGKPVLKGLYINKGRKIVVK